jgi:hypothetical protein
MSSTVSQPDGLCFIALDDKLSVVESCIMLLEDTVKALQGKRADIDYLIGELTDIDVKTASLMMHLKLSVIALRKEVGQIVSQFTIQALTSLKAPTGDPDNPDSSSCTMEQAR